jgi:hypothetical protein
MKACTSDDSHVQRFYLHNIFFTVMITTSVVFSLVGCGSEGYLDQDADANPEKDVDAGGDWDADGGSGVMDSIPADSVEDTCAVRPAANMTAVWPAPVELPTVACDQGTTIRRVKLARGQAPGTFVAFYSTTCTGLKCTQRGLLAQAYRVGQQGPEALCGGDAFVVLDGGNTAEVMDFNVIRRNGPPEDHYYIAYTTVPLLETQHDVRAAQVEFDITACELTVVNERIIKTLPDNNCEKGGEPWFVDRGDRMLFAEWWHEVGPGCPDLGDGDVALQLRSLDYALADTLDPPLVLRSAEPYTPAEHPVFLTTNRYSPFTRLFHGTFKNEAYYLCYNAEENGLGMQAYNDTAAGTFMNGFCGRYDLDVDDNLRYDRSCSTEIVDPTGLDEMYVQGLTVFSGAAVDDPVLVLYSYDVDGTKLCGDGSTRCFDELRLTDLAGNDISVLPPGTNEWGPSEDGFIDSDDLLGRVAVVGAINKDEHCPYVQVVDLD